MLPVPAGSEYNDIKYSSLRTEIIRDLERFHKGVVHVHTNSFDGVHYEPNWRTRLADAAYTAPFVCYFVEMLLNKIRFPKR